MKKTFSIITPSYNQGEFIERTIQSVLSQNFSDIDYTVIDGGSSDNTVEILKKYSPQLSWMSEKDKGQTDAVNKGLRMTQGNIIGWLNSDDIYYPETLSKVAQFFAENPTVDVLYGDANHIDAEDNFLESYYTEEWNIERLKEVCYFCQPAVFFRRKVVAEHGLLADKLIYCMDYEYWLRLALKGVRFVHLKEVLAGSRLHEQTKTLGSRVKVHYEINTMLKNTLGFVPDRWLSNYAHALVESQSTSSRSLRRKLGFQTLLAAWRWNKKISLPLLKTSLGWIVKHKEL